MSDNPFIDQPYAPAPETTPVKILNRYGLFIDNAFVDAEDGAVRET